MKDLALSCSVHVSMCSTYGKVVPARFYVYAVVVHFWWYQLDRARICTTRATFYLPDSLCSYVDFGHFCLFFDPGNFGPKRPKPHILVNVVGLMAVLARSVSWIWVDCFETRIEHVLADGLLKCEHRAHLHGILYDITQRIKNPQICRSFSKNPVFLRKYSFFSSLGKKPTFSHTWCHDIS